MSSTLWTGLVARYCPSLDSTGNGTTTLNNLNATGGVVGSNNGTLTNMDAVSDWVADASNGGVRALDFDGVNDFVDAGTGFATFSKTLPFSVSIWLNSTDATSTLVSKWGRLTQNGWMLWISGGQVWWGLLSAAGGGRYIRTTSTVNNGAWRHIAAAYDGSDSASGLQIYVDGVLQSLVTVSDNDPGILANNALRIGITTGTVAETEHFAGRLDDVCIFSTIKSASDFALLASQRGLLLRRPRINRGLINATR